MDSPVELASRMVVLVDADVWALVDRQTVVAMVGVGFDVVDRPVDGLVATGAVLVTRRTAAVELAGFRTDGIVGAITVITVLPSESSADLSGLVTAVLQAGADYALVNPEPADLAAHIRALTRRLRLDW